MNNQKGFGVVEALLIVLVLAILGGACWHVFNKQQDKNNDKSAQVVNETNADNSQQKPKDSSYKIEELKLALTLNDKTRDLVNKVEGNTASFTLQGFLDKANAAKYSYIDPQGKNSCEKLALVSIYQNVEEIRKVGTEVHGELVDNSGKPTSDWVIHLDDGRYAYIQKGHALCNGDSSFDATALSEENNEATTNIVTLLKTSLKSYSD